MSLERFRLWEEFRSWGSSVSDLLAIGNAHRTIWQPNHQQAELEFSNEYMDFARTLPGRGKNITNVSGSRKAAGLDGRGGLNSKRQDVSGYSPGVCAGVSTFFMELGFFVRMKAMTRHSSSEVLMIPPKGGIGPVTISLRTRL